jgi:molecular chaperone HtpG
MQSYHQPAISGDSERKGTDERDVEFANISATDLDFATDEEKERAEKAQEDYDGLLDILTTRLEGKVSEVRFSAKLGEAPAVVTAAGPVSLEMERVMMQGPDAGMAPRAQRVLELSSSHPVFDKLAAAQEAGNADRVSLYASLLYDQALLMEGLQPEDPVAFARNICELM